MNLVGAGGHVDIHVDHVVSCNELGSDHVSIIMHRWRQHHCSHVVLQPPRDAAVAPLSMEILPPERWPFSRQPTTRAVQRASKGRG